LFFPAFSLLVDAGPSTHRHTWFTERNFGLIRWLLDGKYSYGANFIDWFRGCPIIDGAFYWPHANAVGPSLSTLMKCQPPPILLSGPLPAQCSRMCSLMQYMQCKSDLVQVLWDGVSVKKCIVIVANTGMTHGAIGGPVFDRIKDMGTLARNRVAKEILLFMGSSLCGKVQIVIAAYHIGAGFNQAAVLKCIAEVGDALKAAALDARFFASDSPKNQLAANEALLKQHLIDTTKPVGCPDSTHLFRNMLLPIRLTVNNRLFAPNSIVPISLLPIVMLKALGFLSDIRTLNELFPRDVQNTEWAVRLCGSADELLATPASVNAAAAAAGMDATANLQAEAIELGRFLRYVGRFHKAMDTDRLAPNADDASEPHMSIADRLAIIDESLSYYASVRAFFLCLFFLSFLAWLLSIYFARFGVCFKSRVD
jgi:hypothetical protein